MPVYNCESYIHESVQSILNQTFLNFELIIIDDCSTDNTIAIIKKFSDNRIRLYEKENNSGLIDSLNFGISIAKGEFIARMDGDDICLPERFAKQVDFLKKNSDILLVGTALKRFGVIEDEVRYPVNHKDIAVRLCFNSPFGHPTIMGRKWIFEKYNYNKDFEDAEDYELWTRLVFEGKLANIDEILLFYRTHKNQVSNTKSNNQKLNAIKCRLRMLESLQIGNKYSNEEIVKFLSPDLNSLEECKRTNEFYNFIIAQNEALCIFDNIIFEKKMRNLKMNLLKHYFTKLSFFYPKNVFFLLSSIKLGELILLLRYKFNY
ncbi:MAG: glycosyltransferase [Bacteroidota bacterium]